jgi:hypothetical protein
MSGTPARPAFADPVSGPSYGPLMRVLSTVVVLVLAALAARVLLRTEGWAGSQAWWLLGGTGVAVLGSWWQMLAARTTLDAQGIEQSGLIGQRMSWDDVVLARARGSRLLLKGGVGRFRVFHAGDATLRGAFEQVARAYPRGPR